MLMDIHDLWFYVRVSLINPCQSCSPTAFKAGTSRLSPDPPTNLRLLMDHEVREGQLVTLSCTVESSPPSQLKLMFSRRHRRTPEVLPRQSSHQLLNVLNYTFNATWTHNGDYSCEASYSEETSQTTQMKLVVRCK